MGEGSGSWLEAQLVLVAAERRNESGMRGEGIGGGLELRRGDVGVPRDGG